MSLDRHIAEFRHVVDTIYGTYLDACDGFSRVRAHAVEIEKDSIRLYEELKAKRPELSHLGFGGTEVPYPRWVPAGGQPQYRHLHQVPIEDLKRRNERGGANFQFIGNVCIVTLFQYWDEYYRSLFAQDLGVEKNQIQVPLFGELRQYRHAIIHNGSIATRAVEACVLLKWFRRGEPLLLRREMFEQIIDDILEFLVVLQKTPQEFIASAKRKPFSANAIDFIPH